MSDHPNDDFEALARRGWQAWSDAMRQGPQGGSGVAGWQDAMKWWSALTPSATQPPGAASQAQPWWDLMQQLAGRFAGSQASATDVAAEWRKLLGANPMPDMLRAMRLQGMQGLDAWVDAASPWLDAWQREAGNWLRMPTFGIAREHQERWQKLAQAQLEVRQREDVFNRLLSRVGERSYAIFEDKLASHAHPGKQLTTARALFDLWIDACEEAYAELALSAEFREAWAGLVNAQMRLRAGVQKEIEFASGLFGMPTRTEVDAAHRKIAELERSLRALRDAVPVQAAGNNASDRPPDARKPAPRREAAATAPPVAPRSPGKPATKPPAGKQASSRPKPKKPGGAR